MKDAAFVGLWCEVRDLAHLMERFYRFGISVVAVALALVAARVAMWLLG